MIESKVKEFQSLKVKIQSVGANYQRLNLVSKLFQYLKFLKIQYQVKNTI